MTGIKCFLKKNSKPWRSEIILTNPGKFHEGELETSFEVLISVDGDRNPFRPVWFRVNVMASMNPCQFPTLLLEGAAELLA
jgi:hypothetical protein